MSLLDSTKLFLRVDGTDDDDVIQALIDAASDFVKNGAGVTVAETDPQSVMVMQMIVAWWYEDRNPAKSASAASIQTCPWSIRAQLTQLAYRGDSDDSTSTETSSS
jgi:uncharacterized phage protein (predicted DNA packaging)